MSALLLCDVLHFPRVFGLGMGWDFSLSIAVAVDALYTGLDRTISPGYGRTGRMAGTGQGGRFSLSGRYSAIEPGIMYIHTYYIVHHNMV